MLDFNGNVVDFFPLPSARKSPKLRKAWVKAVKRADFNPGPGEYWHSVCSRHFIDHQPTKENPIPTLFSYKKGKERKTKNSKVYGVHHVSESCTRSPTSEHAYALTDENLVDIDTPSETDIKAHLTTLIVENRHLKTRCTTLEEEAKGLRTQLKNTKCELKETKKYADELSDKLDEKDKLFRELLLEKLTKTDKNVKVFLGLPSVVFLMGLFDILNSHASKMKYWTRQSSSEEKEWQQANRRKPGKPRKLKLFEEFILTLLSLRLDATEFFVQRPRNPTTQSRTWSNYKSKNTFKALVGITPNGAFSFISDLWSGNISDRCITEKSGFLDYIQRSDHVMADRGFLINDTLE
ncbi:uncharacterized protein LOC130054979 [Ostrea edulis]|uniref:uncharacterized protein LOC130054979 n=1 Tax=Ostrea edulis TaxID=37623 RepID=UPI0024AEDEAF|nr:uncharacterized protein LOC130054979 [Ostrea edulis]